MSAASRADVRLVKQLCEEVRGLAVDVIDNLDHLADRRVAEPGYHPQDTVKSAALKRRSMDLTRALAQLRRST